MKRRTFLVAGLAVGGSLMLGWSVLPPRQRIRGSVWPPATGGRLVLNGWVAIAPDETVTVIVPKAEMGQGVHTAIAMMLAEEVDCAWSNVGVEHSPIDGIYANLSVGRDAVPLHPDEQGTLSRTVAWFSDKMMREVGGMVTGGSTSIKDLWDPVRNAGAIARATLINAAAATWDVPAEQCTVTDGVITHGSRAITYGALVRGRESLEPATSWTLKAPSAYRLIGTSPGRLDARAKSDGSARFGMDVRPEGLLYAAVTMSPTIGGDVRTFNADAARAAAGVRAVVRLRGQSGSAQGVAIVADSWPAAQRALAALDVQWDPGANATLSSARIRDELRETAARPGGKTFRRVGDVDEAMARATTTLTATYDVPYLAHTTMEPPNCTVRWNGSRADVWVGTQVPTSARAAVARILDISADDVTVHVQLLGGGFGRRLDVDFIAQAAEIAREVPGVPVQLIWSRTDDVQHDFYRPACAAVLTGGLDASGSAIALRATSASQSIVRAYGARNQVALARFDMHKSAIEGMFDQPYAIPALHVAHHVVQLPVPIGYWRAVGHSHQAFFLESFVDELAHAAEQDALDFRRALLAHHPQALRVLTLIAERSQWDQSPAMAPDGARVARGLALHRSFGSLVAQVADVSLSPAGEIRVHRVTCAVDCGFAVHPEGVAQQMESAVVYGLSAALYGEITIENGQVRERNFDSYRALRLADTPIVETHLVPSMEPPTGVGEIGLPPVAPAVANALFTLTGERLRQLPLRPRTKEAAS